MWIKKSCRSITNKAMVNNDQKYYATNATLYGPAIIIFTFSEYHDNRGFKIVFKVHPLYQIVSETRPYIFKVILLT